jgi:hypothetical protein
VPAQNLLPGQPTELLRSKRFRLTVGNGAVIMKVNGKEIDVPDRADAVGYEIRARGAPRELPPEERPTCQ